LLKTAHVWRSPADPAVAVVMPETVTGDRAMVEEPFPS
jgi:hypothetical protein